MRQMALLEFSESQIDLKIACGFTFRHVGDVGVNLGRAVSEFN